MAAHDQEVFLSTGAASNLISLLRYLHQTAFLQVTALYCVMPICNLDEFLKPLMTI